MKILVVGSGGREHALCKKISESPLTTALYCAPGNPGIAHIATCVPIDVLEIESLVSFSQKAEIDLVVIGPEAPLSLGLTDQLQAAGIAVFGPTKQAARIEVSKTFAKEVMNAAGVRTAEAFSANTKTGVVEAIKKIGEFPVVLKADGLASGKGVFILESNNDIDSSLEALFTDAAGNKKSEVDVLVERFIRGCEASFIVCVDGLNVTPLAASHDYKRIGEGNIGLNTGGMGTVSPTPFLTAVQETKAIQTVIEPVLREMVARGCAFRGFLFAGLMITEQDEVYVLEFNARSGDPETQVILARLKSDFVPLLATFAHKEGFHFNNLKPLEWHEQTTVCVVHASGGYPAKSSKGDIISGLEHASLVPDAYVLHAGTSLNEQGLLCTNGGRVLNIVGKGNSVEEAMLRAYQVSDLIQFRGKQVRRDIGKSNAAFIAEKI
jgi:phosphoribosylamine---glycine ligase